MAALAVIVAASGWAGHAARRVEQEEQREAMVISYLTELDPRVQISLKP